MSRISIQAVANAVKKINAMNMDQKMILADEIFIKQPNMLSSVVALRSMGVSLEKMTVAFEILFVCFQAMKESKLAWPLITEDDQEKQLKRYIAIVKFGTDLSTHLEHTAIKQYVESHPEQPLLAFISSEHKKFLECNVAQNSDRFLILSTVTLVNCIAFVALPKATRKS
jgi:hypothetical protein